MAGGVDRGLDKGALERFFGGRTLAGEFGLDPDALCRDPPHKVEDIPLQSLKRAGVQGPQVDLGHTLLGDGELNSGQVWEAVMTAAKYRLGNLVAIVDRNGCQIDGETDDVMPLEPLAPKFTAFGWGVQEIDGHDVVAILEALRQAQSIPAAPQVIIARTVKGRGVSFMEGRYEWHSGQVSEEQARQASAELGSV